jgi:hypothetical protein
VPTEECHENRGMARINKVSKYICYGIKISNIINGVEIQKRWMQKTQLMERIPAK